MEARTRVFVSLFVLVALIAGFYFFSDWFSKTTGYVLGEDQKIAFAECLSDAGAVLYITPNCAECDAQRTILGEAAYAKIAIRTCDATSRCTGLTSLPAWELEGKFYYGVKEFTELDAISSCNIPQHQE